MKVVIVGAGAIGLLIGSYLGEQNHEIRYVTRTSDQAHQLRVHGVTRLLQNGEKQRLSVHAVSNIGQAPQDALWIVSVKVHHLHDIAEDIQSLPMSTPLVFIQNGLEHLRWMERLPHEQLYIATIEHGAMKKNPTTVLHKGIGLTKVAPFRKSTKEQVDVSIFQSPSFQIEVMEDAHAIVLRKAILNACINPITYILQIKNGELITNSYANHLMKTIFIEIEKAFPEIIPNLSFDDVQNLCEKTSNNHSSMFQDRQNQRKTEIDPIVGAILRLAAERNKKLPVLETVYQLILAAEEKGKFHG